MSRHYVEVEVYLDEFSDEELMKELRHRRQPIPGTLDMELLRTRLLANDRLGALALIDAALSPLSDKKAQYDAWKSGAPKQ